MDHPIDSGISVTKRPGTRKALLVMRWIGPLVRILPYPARSRIMTWRRATQVSAIPRPFAARVANRRVGALMT